MPRSNAITVVLMMLVTFTALPAAAQDQAAPASEPAMPPGHPTKPQLLAAEGVMMSANIARGASDICHIDAAKVARFESAARANFPDAPDFDAEWKLGLAQAQPTVDRFDKLKTSNPTEYKKEIGEACPALNRGIDEVTSKGK